jgi:hypothetical protein
MKVIYNEFNAFPESAIKGKELLHLLLIHYLSKYSSILSP